MKARIVAFLRRLFRAYSDGLRQAGYPDTYAGSTGQVPTIVVEQRTDQH